MFTCEAPIKAYLCKMYQLHNIPVYGARAEDHMNTLIQNSNVFFTGNHRHSVVKSSYSASMSTSSSLIRDRNWLKISLDTAKIGRLETKIENAEKALEKISQNESDKREEFKQIDQQLESTRKEIKAKKGIIDRKRVLKGKLDVQRSQIAAYKREQKPIDLVKERNNLEAKKDKFIREDVELCQQLVTAMEKNSKVRQRIDLAKAAAGVYHSSEVRLRNDLSEEREELRRVQEQLGEMEEDLRAAKEQYIRQLRSAQSVTAEYYEGFRGNYLCNFFRCRSIVFEELLTILVSHFYLLRDERKVRESTRVR